MLSLDTFNQRRRMKERQKRVMQNIQYRQSMRDMDSADKKIQQTINSYTSMAIAKENAGEHEQAIRLAGKAQQLSQYQSSSGNIRSAVETGYAMGTINQAMADILRASGGLVESTTNLATPAAFSEAQIGMQLMNENMAFLMQESEYAAQDTAVLPEDSPHEGAEAFLRQIMLDVGKEKRATLLRNTSKQLDRLKQIRTEDK